jgi:hypothetical protein
VVPTGILALDCPGLDSKGNIGVALGTKTWTFKPRCGADYPGNDMGAVIVYSFHDCLQACAAHNYFSGKNECVAVEFNANMNFYIAEDFGNCWLKTVQGAEQAFGGNLNAGALLVSR